VQMSIAPDWEQRVGVTGPRELVHAICTRVVGPLL
jgi:hypothetical protein